MHKLNLLKRPLLTSRIDVSIHLNHLRLHRVILIASFFLIGCVASIIMWKQTPYGLNVGHDSLFYFTTAENLASGRGLVWTGSGGELKPFTVFAPIYPLVLASLNWISPSFDFSARVIAAAFFGFNIALVGSIIYTFTKRWIAGIIGSLIFMVSPVVLKNHLGAMSEPFFSLQHSQPWRHWHCISTSLDD